MADQTQIKARLDELKLLLLNDDTEFLSEYMTFLNNYFADKATDLHQQVENFESLMESVVQ